MARLLATSPLRQLFVSLHESRVKHSTKNGEDQLSRIWLAVLGCLSLALFACETIESHNPLRPEPTPPSVSAVLDRAEAIEAQMLFMLRDLAGCPRAISLDREYEEMMDSKYPGVRAGIRDVKDFSNTRLAWDIMDDIEDQLVKLSDACRR